MIFAQIAVYLGAPALFTWLSGRSKVVQTLSPVVLCYGAGLALANTGLALPDPKLAENVMTGAVLLAIPLLLFSADFVAWLRLARSTAIGMTVACASVIVATVISASVFVKTLPETWRISG